MTQVKRRATTDSHPLDRLKGEAGSFVQALGDRALASVREKVVGSTGRLLDYAENGGGSGLMAAATGVSKLAEGKSPGRALVGAAGKAVKGLLGRFGGGGGRGGRGKKLKVTNIVEEIDVGVPVRLAYDQWTQFTEFPSFMKKVENVEQKSEEEVNWKAQILWSHRNWESTIKRQVPDEAIVWTSKGQKGHVDGAVTFHEISPNLTRILVALEYYPQGGFEHIGNLWRAQGRRVRLELKHYRRHMMTQAVLRPDEIQGWRGVIEDGEVVKDHETALADEQRGQEPTEYAGDDEAGDDEAGYDEAEGEEDEEDTVRAEEYDYSGRRG
jgi:Polyketide cyclase / dehydrase and lipid transport